MSNSNLIKFIDSTISADDASQQDSFHTYLKDKLATIMLKPKSLAEAYFTKLATKLLEFTGDDSRIKLTPGGKVLVDGKLVGHVEEENMMDPSYDPDKSTGGIKFITTDGKKAEFENLEGLYQFIANRFLKTGLV